MKFFLQFLVFISSVSLIIFCVKQPTNPDEKTENEKPILEKPLLEELEISEGVLSPVFNQTDTNYTTTVSNPTTEIWITPTLNDSNGILKVNGDFAKSREASKKYPLKVGENTISIVLMDQDSTSQKTYTLVVTRLRSSDAKLKEMTITNGLLSPNFNPSDTNYTVIVPNAITEISVTPTLSDSNATMTVNSDSIKSGETSKKYPLSVGNNTISIAITAQDSTSQNTYTIIVTRSPSNNTKLKELTISSGNLSPEFNSSVTSYTATVSNAVTEIWVTPTLSDSNASLKVNGDSTKSGEASRKYPLNLGKNTITILVMAQDGTSQATYTLIVTRLPSTDAKLKVLTISNGVLNPNFNSSLTSYSVTVSNTITEFSVTPSVNEPNATMTVNDDSTKSGEASRKYPLNVGKNIISIVVTAQDGVSKATYTIIVTRLPSTDAKLKKLIVSNGVLNPDFNSSITSYSVTVSNTITEFSVIPSVNESNATITINGDATKSGENSKKYPLNAEENTITIVVTAQDGVSQETYTISVLRSIKKIKTGHWDGNGLKFNVVNNKLIENFVYQYNDSYDKCSLCRISVKRLSIDDMHFSLTSSISGFKLTGAFIDSNKMYVNLTINPNRSSLSIGIVSSFNTPGPDPQGLAFDGTYIWNADYEVDKLYKLNTSGTIISSFDSPGSNSTGLAFDGTHMWHADWISKKIYKINTSGAVLDSFKGPDAWPTGLAFDGTYLWHTDRVSKKIYKLDTSGSIIRSFDSPGDGPTGLAFDGRYLWNADINDDKIYKLDTSGVIIFSFNSPGPWPTGLAFDGTHLWHADMVKEKIYKIFVSEKPNCLLSNKAITLTWR